MSNLYSVHFAVSKKYPVVVPSQAYSAPAWIPVDRCDYGECNRVDQYRGLTRSVLLLAASAHPKDILVPLSNNVTLGSGEGFEILTVKPVQAGTEGQAVIGAAAGLVFLTDFQVRLPAPVPAPGAPGAPLNVYVKPPRKALVAASSSAGVLGVLNANIALLSGEILELLGVKQFTEGSENGAVWN